MTAKAATRADEIYARLRADILSGRLRPGRRLQFGELGRRYDASVGVLREVLFRLTEQGLVSTEPQLGFRVVSLSEEDLVHLIEARVAIETILVRQAIQHGDLGWESAIVAAHHTMARIPPLTPDGEEANPEWLDAHAHYHQAVLSASPNRRLRAIADGIRDADQLYRAWAGRLPKTEERIVAKEHRQILEAVLARDADAAVELLAGHIEASRHLRTACRRVGAVAGQN